jgi:hypothetical protein
MRDDVANLAELLNEGVQGFPLMLLDAMEVSLVARPSIGALKVGSELTAQLRLGIEGPLRQVHEPRPSHSSQGHKEVVGHDDLIPSRHKDRGGVDL